MAVTFVSKKCSCILELNKVLNFVQITSSKKKNSRVKQTSYLLISMALLLLIVPTWY